MSLPSCIYSFIVCELTILYTFNALWAIYHHRERYALNKRKTLLHYHGSGYFITRQLITPTKNEKFRNEIQSLGTNCHSVNAKLRLIACY